MSIIENILCFTDIRPFQFIFFFFWWFFLYILYLWSKKLMMVKWHWYIILLSLILYFPLPLHYIIQKYPTHHWKCIKLLFSSEENMMFIASVCISLKEKWDDIGPFQYFYCCLGSFHLMGLKFIPWVNTNEDIGYKTTLWLMGVKERVNVNHCICVEEH